jgi:hypothetical protein
MKITATTTTGDTTTAKVSWTFRWARPRISYFALLATTTCAALLGESRMQALEATAHVRKSGGCYVGRAPVFIGLHLVL